VEILFSADLSGFSHFSADVRLRQQSQKLTQAVAVATFPAIVLFGGIRSKLIMPPAVCLHGSQRIC
jgi:hypothetical protein